MWKRNILSMQREPVEHSESIQPHAGEVSSTYYYIALIFGFILSRIGTFNLGFFNKPNNGNSLFGNRNLTYTV